MTASLFDDPYERRLAKALSDYNTRFLRRPAGTRALYNRFFYPDEHLTCCHGVRPSTQHPEALIEHCRTWKHIACRHRVTVADLRHVQKGKSFDILPSQTSAVKPMEKPA